MAIEAARARVPLSVGARLSGLNHSDSGKELARFMADMRDKRDPFFEENSRALAALFFMARLPVARHECDISELTTEEKRALITAMNHFRAVVSLFPERLTMPL